MVASIVVCGMNGQQANFFYVLLFFLSINLYYNFTLIMH